MTIHSLPPSDWTWIDTDAGFQACVAQWRSAPVLFLDTEFIRVDTFFPIPGVLQVNDGRQCSLVDAQAISDWSAFGELLEDPGVVKVLHSCSEDLQVLERLTGRLPQHLFDTQIAAALAGLGASLGYQNLVRQLVGVELPKEHTRSDWLARPLSQAQLEYAVLDVVYLAEVYHRLVALLEGGQRVGWVFEEGDRLLAAYGSEGPDQAYTRLKLAWQLNRRQLRILRDLLRWREVTARERNVPRGFLLKDDAALAIARRRPRHQGELSSLKEVPPAPLRRYGGIWLELVHTAQLASEDDLPPSLPRPLNPFQQERFAELKRTVETVAEAAGVPAELLLRRRDMEAMVRACQPCLPEGLAGWRSTLLAEALAGLEWQGGSPTNTTEHAPPRDGASR